MSDAFRESDTMLFRNSVTFVTGFGVIADQPFNIGNSTSVNSPLNAYNQINPIGGISGIKFSITSSLPPTTTGTIMISDGKSLFPFNGFTYSNTILSLNSLIPLVVGGGMTLQNSRGTVGTSIYGDDANQTIPLNLQTIVGIGDMDGNQSAFNLTVDGVNNFASIGILGNNPYFYVDGNTSFIGINTSTATFPFDIRGNTRISGNLMVTGGNITVSGIPVLLTSQTGGFASNTNLYSTGNILQTEIVNFSGGLFSQWSNLTWNTGTVWNANSSTLKDKKILTLTGNTTLQINNLYNGWEGVLETIQSGASTSGYSLIFPSNTKVINSGIGLANLTKNSGAIDIIGFFYNGVSLFAGVGTNFN